MKKLLYILPVIALIVTSCSLDEESRVEMEMGKYMRNAAEAEKVLLGVYQPMTSEYMYGYHLSLLFPLGTDLAQVEGNVTSSPREIPTNFHNASTKEINQTWNTLYNAIYNANSFLAGINERKVNWTGKELQLAEYYIAEARAMRALYYFELLRWFGNIVIITDPEESYLPNEYFSQVKPEVAYAFIESELKAVAEVLPWAAEDHVRESNAWRMSKGGVLGLLTRVYCTWAGYPVRDETKWAEAAKTAKVLVESGRHGLLPDYKTLWENAGASIWDATESLIEVSFFWSTKTGKEPVGFIGKWNGVITTQTDKRGTCQARARVVYPFCNKWLAKNDAANDKRFKLSVADYCHGYSSSKWTFNGQTYVFISTNDKVNYQEALDYEAKCKTEISGKEVTVSEDQRNGPRFTKYTPAKWDVVAYNSSSPIFNVNYNSTVNWHVLRYSDVLLMYAEALNESQGPSEVAFAAVNLVRRRAFGDATHDLRDLSQEELRQAIRDERSYELCFEGQRKSDLIRWGIYYQTIRQTAQDVVDQYEKGTYLIANFTQQGKHELMPIPQTQLDVMPLCHQNPGWGN